MIKGEQKKVVARISKVGDYLHTIIEIDGANQHLQDIIHKELDEMDAGKNNLMEQFVAYQQRNLEKSRAT